jgi:hypothetical protein
MATFRDGILGGFKGLVGTVIGSTWRTLNVMKKRPKPSTKAPVQAQIDQRIKFGLMTDFLSNARKHVDLGFQSYNGVLTPMNGAVRLNIDAFTGTSPNFIIDYSKIVLSTGKLPGPVDVEMTPAVDAITFKWTVYDTSSAEDDALRNTDLLALFAYNPSSGFSLTNTGMATRAALTRTLDLPRPFLGSPLHVWLYYVSANRKSVSKSRYLGQITVPKSV